jgi:rubrerythrin
MMPLAKQLRRLVLRRLVSTPEGRAHVLSLMIAAEEGDEAGVFDRLMSTVDDPKLRKLIDRHQRDERRHAEMYRACLKRNGVEPRPVPGELMIIRHVGRTAGDAFAAGVNGRSAAAIVSREDIMNTYALLLAIEERGVQQFPLIGAEFRRIGDHDTAETFEQVAEDERRHTRYCHAIGRRHAPDGETWERAVERYRRIEQRAFKEVGLATLRHVMRNGLLWKGALAHLAAKIFVARETRANAQAQ